MALPLQVPGCLCSSLNAVALLCIGLDWIAKASIICWISALLAAWYQKRHHDTLPSCFPVLVPYNFTMPEVAFCHDRAKLEETAARLQRLLETAPAEDSPARTPAEDVRTSPFVQIPAAFSNDMPDGSGSPGHVADEGPAAKRRRMLAQAQPSMF